jgi:hypothetical protein
MLGFGPLGELALGQLPVEEQAAGVAPGDLIVLTLTLAAGAAHGEEVRPPHEIIPGGIGTRLLVYDAVAPGARLILDVSLLPGRAKAVPQPLVPVTIDGTAHGGLFVLQIGVISSGRADGFDAFAHDNDFLLLAAA